MEVKQPATAISVSNFDIINFTLPSGTTDGSKILNASTVNLSGTKINVGAVSGLTLNTDDTITLIHTTNGITGTFTVGDITIDGDWEIKQNGNDIILINSNVPLPPIDPPTPINDDGYGGAVAGSDIPNIGIMTNEILEDALRCITGFYDNCVFRR